MPTSLWKSLDLTSQRFELCYEISAKLALLQIRIKEVPISYSPRYWQEGKKIRAKDGFMAISTLFWWRFFSSHWRNADFEFGKSCFQN